MSDIWQQLKAVKSAIVAMSGLAIVLMGAGGLFIEWRIDVNVRTALAAQDLGTDSKIVTMDQATASNTTGVAENKEDITGLEARVQLAFQALMRNPE